MELVTEPMELDAEPMELVAEPVTEPVEAFSKSICELSIQESSSEEEEEDSDESSEGLWSDESSEELSTDESDNKIHPPLRKKKKKKKKKGSPVQLNLFYPDWITSYILKKKLIIRSSGLDLKKVDDEFGQLKLPPKFDTHCILQFTYCPGKSFTFNWVRQCFGEEDDDDDDKPIIVRDVSDRFALKMPYLSKYLTHSVPLNVPPNWGMESDGSRRL